ncbi:MAG: serine--tRNA ligase [Deltaproteobacteria bacterium]|jgi:seryl-tRNA synthetase|nr:serine--tRNA ligase [Deltaproteobacteria bacterium]
MHDLKFVRENIPLIRETLEKRLMDPSLMDGFEALDQKRRSLLRDIEALKAKRNLANDQITELKKKKEPTDQIIAAMKDVSARIKEMDPWVSSVEEEEKALLKTIPNLVHPTVPLGDESHNLEVRKWGKIPEFAWEPLNHWEIGEKLGVLDFPRAAKISGARFAVLYGDLARLNRALINFMLELHALKQGYREVWPPALVNGQSLYGTGQLPKFADDLFKVENTDLYLIPTAEVPVTNLLRDETLAADELPIKLTAYTPCFRAEAGAAGRDARGLIRMHQFDKVELVQFTAPDQSMEALESLTRDAEEVLRLLELPYRVVALASGDLGFSATKTYDIEVWLPGARTYREISSCSCFTDFQARRANIRWKAPKSSKSEFPHTLNGSGLAVGRTLVAIMENYQNADGTFSVPAALQPYFRGGAALRAAPLR